MDYLSDWLTTSFFFEKTTATALARWIGLGIVFLLAFVARLLGKFLLVDGLSKLAKKTKVKWDDALHTHKVFDNLARLIPGLVVYGLTPYALEDWQRWSAFIQDAALLYLIVVGFLTIGCLLDAVHTIYRSFQSTQRIPIKGFLQVIKIVVFLIAVILTGSVLLNRSPAILLGGFGALTAVLMLIFKDAILGFVAGIQLTANKMVSYGDWIEMEKYGADGDVIDIALTTVKVQNWDKTITTIPTYALISESFKNWRGMSESGGRRIARSISIDVHSVRFCTDEMLKRFSKVQLISEYLKKRKKDIANHNKSNRIDPTNAVNCRRLTNLGTFRKYVEAYLKSLPVINQEMTFLVRQLRPTENGVPIQIYVFCSDKVWANYEAIQSDIFDHLLAVVPEFDLAVFQNPTGADFKKIISGAKSAKSKGDYTRDL